MYSMALTRCSARRTTKAWSHQPLTVKDGEAVCELPGRDVGSGVGNPHAATVLARCALHAGHRPLAFDDADREVRPTGPALALGDQSQEFDFTVLQYRTGPKNENADVPSRYPLPTTVDETGARADSTEKVIAHAKPATWIDTEQLGTGEVHRLFDLHFQEELECNKNVVFGTDHPEVIRCSGRLTRVAWDALSRVHPVKGMHSLRGVPGSL
eukprot:gene34472-biopygen31021